MARPARPGANAVFALDVRHEFLQKEIAVAYRAVGRVDVEAAPALRRDDQKIAHLVLVAQIVEQRPAAAVEKCLLVVAQAVQKIEHRISLRRMLRRARVVAGGQVDAVMDDMFQDVAVQRAAIDAALRAAPDAGNSSESRTGRRQSRRVTRIIRVMLTRSAAPARDRVWRRGQRDTGRRPGSR